MGAGGSRGDFRLATERRESSAVPAVRRRGEVGAERHAAGTWAEGGPSPCRALWGYLRALRMRYHRRENGPSLPSRARRGRELRGVWIRPKHPTRLDPPRGPAPQQISGTERIGWTQTASGPAEVIALRYAAYVDGTRSELCDSSCAAGQAETAFECSSSLPPMSPGLHTIELVAYFAGFESLESARSSPIQVQMTGAGTAVCAEFSASTSGSAAAVVAAAKDLVPLTLATTDGIRLRVELVADGLAEPTDVAFAPDGRIFVAERAGRIRLVRDGVLQPASAATLEDVTTAGEGGLLGLAVDPQFAAQPLRLRRSHHTCGRQRRSVPHRPVPRNT